MQTSITQEKIIVICAPSGSGKTSIYNRVLMDMPILSKSISATNREPRGTEKDGIEYHFLSSTDQFMAKVANGEFVEWEQVYPGKFYGTLKSEITRINSLGHVPLLDIDVKGAQSVKEIYGDNALIIFIKVPGDNPFEIIKKRLIDRNTEDEAKIQVRLDRLPEELTYESKCDVVVNNLVLEDAITDTKKVIQDFLSQK